MGVISHENSIDYNNFTQVGRLLCGSYAMNFFPLRAHLIGEKEKIREKNMLGWEVKRGGSEMVRVSSFLLEPTIWVEMVFCPIYGRGKIDKKL